MPAGFEPATAANSAPMTLHINSTPDATTWLPPGAADKLRDLRQHAADLRALCPPFEDRQAAAAAKVEAEQRLKRLQAHHASQGGGFGLKDDDPRVIAARKHLEEATAAA